MWKTSLNSQNLMPLKVFQHSPNYLQSYKVIRYKIATYLFSTLKNLQFMPTLAKIPNGNPAEMLWTVRFFTKNTLGNLHKTLGKPWETLGKRGKSLLDTLLAFLKIWSQDFLRFHIFRYFLLSLKYMTSLGNKNDKNGA